MKSEMQCALVLSLALASLPSTAALKLDLNRQCPAECTANSATVGWPAMCQQPACSVCPECATATTPAPLATTAPAAACAAGWAAFGTSCYVVSPSTSDQPSAKNWCTAQGAQLVSISTGEENVFVRSVCGKVSCWLGLTEKVGTGDVSTPPSQQQWVWDDGNVLSYSNWKLWPMPFQEPNNWGGMPMVNDERFAYMNSGEHGANFEGYWYDSMEGHQAKALCEITAGQVPNQAPSAMPCTPGWSDFGGKCYLADNVTKDWHSAETWCKALNADLVSVNNPAENEHVRKLCGFRLCWLGLSEKVGTGNGATPQADQQWVWNDGSTVANYSNWKDWGGVFSEPNNWVGDQPMTGDERNGFMNFPQAGAKGYWYDAKPTTAAYAICEKDMV